MKYNLLTKTILTSAIMLGLSACGGTDSGFNPGFGESKDEVVTFSSDNFTANTNEDSGVQTIDLLTDAFVGDTPLSSTNGAKFIKNINFVAPDTFTTPQAESNTVPNHRISPFTVDGSNLLVDTDLFSESLRECDTTGNFPSSITYEVSYTIDNGNEVESERLLMLTINAVNDPVTEITASNVEVQEGALKPLVATTLPNYVCDASLSYTVADPSIASVDEATGMVTGLATGTTEVIVGSVSDPEQTNTVSITVLPSFALNVTNTDLDENGVAVNTKELPTCVASGIKLEPSLVDDDLTGAYAYSWSSSNTTDVELDAVIANGFGEIQSLKVGEAVGETSMVEASLVSGYTGALDIAEVQTRTLAVTTVQNELCAPGESQHAAGFNTDFSTDVTGAPYKGSGVFAASTDTVSGSVASLQITAADATRLVNIDGVETELPLTWAAQQVFNKQRNWYSTNYGRGFESIGKTYRFAVWVKLEQMPAEPVILRQVIVPWVFNGVVEGARGFPGRYTPGGAAFFTTELAATTEWQYIEFVRDGSNQRDWSIPGTWDVVTDVFTIWEIFGLPEGNSILIDEYSVVRTDEE